MRLWATAGMVVVVPSTGGCTRTWRAAAAISFARHSGKERGHSTTLWT